MKMAKKFDGRFAKMVDPLPIANPFIDRPYFVDHAIRSYSASPATVHSGFSSLEGTTVAVLADGLSVGDFVVTGGEITLPSAATEVIAGMKYKAKIKTMPIDEGGTIGDSVGTVKRIDELGIRFYNTVDAKFGTHFEDGAGFDSESIEFDNTGKMYDGMKTVKLQNGWSGDDGDYSILIEQESPTPLTVLSLTYKGQSGN